MRSNISARLARPVSGSWNARWWSSWSLCRSASAIVLKASATWLNSANESSSARWLRSPLPSLTAEVRSVRSGRRIELMKRRAISSVSISVTLKASMMPSSCVRWSARSLDLVGGRARDRLVRELGGRRAHAVERRLEPAAVRGGGEVSGGERLQAGEIAVEHGAVQHQHVGVRARERAAHARTRRVAAVARRAQHRVLGGVERRLEVGDAAEAHGDGAPVLTGVVDLRLLLADADRRRR